jgi:hypothetical protein
MAENHINALTFACIDRFLSEFRSRGYRAFMMSSRCGDVFPASTEPQAMFIADTDRAVPVTHAVSVREHFRSWLVPGAYR